MSHLLENLRSRLARVFHLAPEAQCQACEAEGITLTAYLPDEDSAIEAVFAIGRDRKIAAATACRIEDAEELARTGSPGWRLAMTFYVSASERDKLETDTGAILASFGGRWAQREQHSLSGRRAA
jgi:hypothetical protein